MKEFCEYWLGVSWRSIWPAADCNNKDHQSVMVHQMQSPLHCSTSASRRNTRGALRNRVCTTAATTTTKKHEQQPMEKVNLDRCKRDPRNNRKNHTESLAKKVGIKAHTYFMARLRDGVPGDG
jgi:hypothetical protein